jgi:hypothetical protein
MHHHVVSGIGDFVAPGQRYRDVRIGVYGRSADAEWIVETVRADALGVQHAQLINAADRTERRTLSAAVLVDPSRFEEV